MTTSYAAGHAITLAIPDTSLAVHAKLHGAAAVAVGRERQIRKPARERWGLSSLWQALRRAACSIMFEKSVGRLGGIGKQIGANCQDAARGTR